MTDAEARAERVAICIEAGVLPSRAAAIADCELAARSSRSPRCTCGAGHRYRGQQEALWA